MQRKPLARILTGAALGAALVLAAPLAASAHVTIDPNQGTAGGWAYVTFRAPDESTTAGTTKIVVHLPEDTPITSVSYRPTPGWTATVETETLPKPVTVSGNTITKAPRTVTFQAEPGQEIAPGQFQTFTVALGPLPDTGHIVLPVTQTYSDGKVVEWKATPADVAKDDTLEPAPVLYIGETAPAGGHDAAPSPAATAAEAPAASASSDGIALGLSIAALVLSVGAVLSAAVLLRGRRRE
ncbi:YcnI family protein [Microbacterium sp. ASV49]|uniref:YcnI family protein n=1 Tax=Microbacterium candidum TaxID=3041922 RepID=A0ABT7N220_9MICO|nr:YcnI family protein [Microbacterium sp. ASV49]MDL9980759.1 YcnI family protein [Microbacterium sp. ASV49]